MSTIHFHGTTTSTPEEFIAGLTDYGPGRSALFKNSADGYMTVHHRVFRQADVTEGSGGIWERLHHKSAPIPASSSLRPPTPTCLAAHRVIPTLSRGGPME